MSPSGLAPAASALDRKFNIFDLKVQMHRRPVAAIIAWQRNLRRGGASRWFAQEVHVRRYPDHLGHRAAEKTPAKAEAKCTLVEGYPLLKIVDVDVDQKFLPFTIRGLSICNCSTKTLPGEFVRFACLTLVFFFTLAISTNKIHSDRNCAG